MADRRIAALAAAGLDEGSEVLFLDGFDACLIGVVRKLDGPPCALYSVDQVLEVLQARDGMAEDEVLEVLQARDGMAEDEALEFFGVNIDGPYVGPQTPLYTSCRFF